MRNGGNKRVLRLCSLLFRATAIFSLIISSCSADEQEKSVNWEAIRKVYNEYLEYPSTENAIKLFVTLPSLDIGKLRANDNDVVRYMFEYQNYRVLEIQMWAGDRNAIRVAYRLFNITSASTSETLGISLASLIRINPLLFLEELAANMDYRSTQNFEYPIFMTDEAYIDRMNAGLYELKMRIEALASVERENLKALRDNCINQLKEYVNKISAQ